MAEENEVISKDLLDILACPACKTEVKLVDMKDNQKGLKCIQCRRIFPIKEGIPVMLLTEAIIQEE